MSLYKIKSEFQEKLTQYLATHDTETGEILDENSFIQLRKELEELENQANESLEETLKYRQNIESEIVSYDSEIERLIDAKQKLAKKSESLSRYIQYFFRTLWKGNTVHFWLFQLGYRKSTAVNITDESALPAEYLRIIPETKAPDKKMIKEALKEWKKIAGAELEERENFFIK